MTRRDAGEAHEALKILRACWRRGLRSSEDLEAYPVHGDAALDKLEDALLDAERPPQKVALYANLLMRLRGLAEVRMQQYGDDLSDEDAATYAEMLRVIGPASSPSELAQRLFARSA